MSGDSPLDAMIRRSVILADLGINASTLKSWIDRGIFPKPLVLNAGAGAREIVGWPTSVYRAWKASLPQRSATPITAKSYSAQAKAKGRATRAAKRAPAAPAE